MLTLQEGEKEPCNREESDASASSFILTWEEDGCRACTASHQLSDNHLVKSHVNYK